MEVLLGILFVVAILFLFGDVILRIIFVIGGIILGIYFLSFFLQWYSSPEQKHKREMARIRREREEEQRREQEQYKKQQEEEQRRRQQEEERRRRQQEEEWRRRQQEEYRRQQQEEQWRKQQEEEQRRQQEKRRQEEKELREKVIREEKQGKLIPTEIKVREKDEAQDVSEAGDIGEKLLADAFESHGNYSDCYWWLNKRVKSKIGESGPNEIDLIVISHNNIYIFESKYYRGTLINNPNTIDKENPWIIVKPKRDKENRFVNNDTKIGLIPNLLETLKVKLDKLKAMLAEEKINVPSDNFKFNVVFTHKSLVIDQSVSNRNGLISINDLKSYLDSDKTTVSEYERLVIALIRHIVFSEGNTSKFSPKIPESNLGLLTSNLPLLQFIDSLPSWDSITYYGGKTVKGDVLEIRGIFEGQGDLRFLNERCDIVVDCKRNPQEIKFDWNQGKKQSIEVKGANGNTIGWYSIDYFNPEIKFHIVGEPSPERIFIYEIEKIHLGGLYRLGNEKTC